MHIKAERQVSFETSETTKVDLNYLAIRKHEKGYTFFFNQTRAKINFPMRPQFKLATRRFDDRRRPASSSFTKKIIHSFQGLEFRRTFIQLCYTKRFQDLLYLTKVLLSTTQYSSVASLRSRSIKGASLFMLGFTPLPASQ